MRPITKLALVTLLSLIVGAAVSLFLSHDPVYTLHEWLDYSNFHRYDAEIKRVGGKYGVDPMLIKALIWRESAFQAGKVGRNGERGLMQVTVPAASDWAKARKVETFDPRDLFIPETNIEIGVWYLKQSLQYYSGKDDPVPFALAEYNAGRRRVNRWIGENNLGPVTASDLQQNISFPSTRSYVQAIQNRYNFYKKRAWM